MNWGPRTVAIKDYIPVPPMPHLRKGAPYVIEYGEATGDWYVCAQGGAILFVSPQQQRAKQVCDKWNELVAIEVMKE